MAGSGHGFGHGPFGHFPLGHTAYGNEVTIDVTPEEYLDQDKDYDDVLRKTLLIVSNSMQNRKSEVDQFDTLLDPITIREDILFNLGTTLDVELDDFEPEAFQRSLVQSAALTYQFKGTQTGYEVRGKISGYDVEIINFWRIPESTAAIISGVDPEFNHLFEFPPGSGEISGIWYTDYPPGTIDGASGTATGAGDPRGEDCSYCLTGYIKIRFLLVKEPPGSLEVNFLDRVIEKLEEVKPIHVRRLFVDLEVQFLAEVDIEAEMRIDEDISRLANPFPRYDIFSADEIECDSSPLVQAEVEITTT